MRLGVLITSCVFYGATLTEEIWLGLGLMTLKSFTVMAVVTAKQ